MKQTPICTTKQIQVLPLRNDPILFYVNDLSTANDVYTMALGNSTNSGLEVLAPLSSIQEVFHNYDLEPGDTIFVDTGNYNLSSAVTINEFDQGTAANPIIIQGSTNDVDRTLLNKSSGNIFDLDETAGIALRDLTLRLADRGVLGFKSDDITIERVRCESVDVAFEILNSSGYTFRNCLVTGGGYRCLGPEFFQH